MSNDRVDDLEQRLSDLSLDVDSVKKQVEVVGSNVTHNCNLNKENFEKLNKKFDDLNEAVLTTIGTVVGTVSELSKGLGAAVGQINTNQDQINLLSDRTHKLSIALTKRSMALWAILIAMILSFIGGSLVKWSDVEKYFDRTTASERAEIVKQAVETAVKVK